MYCILYEGTLVSKVEIVPTDTSAELRVHGHGLDPLYFENIEDVYRLLSLFGSFGLEVLDFEICYEEI